MLYDRLAERSQQALAGMDMPAGQLHVFSGASEGRTGGSPMPSAEPMQHGMALGEVGSLPALCPTCIFIFKTLYAFVILLALQICIYGNFNLSITP